MKLFWFIRCVWFVYLLSQSCLTVTLWTRQPPLSVGVFRQGVAISFSRGPSWPRDRTRVSCDSWDSGLSECEVPEGWVSLINECLTCSREGLAQTGDGAQAALWCLNCEHCHVLKPLSEKSENESPHWSTCSMPDHCHFKQSILCLPDSYLFNKNLPHHLPHSLLKPFYVGRKWELSIFKACIKH